MKKVMLAILCVTAFQYSYTQADSATLDPVTVTASLSAVQSSRTGRNIVMIQGESFQKLPVHSLDELLRYIPGIEVQARGPQGAQSDIVLRGGTFQQVLVVVDGLRLNDPNTGHFNAYIPIAPSEIERIEILKGASSAIHGSDAVGGVVHIITKTFAAQNAKHQQVTGQLTFGEYGLVNAQAGGFYSNGKTALSAGMLTTNANGQPQRGIRGYFHNHTISVSAHHRFNEYWQLSLRSSFDSRDFAAQNFYTTFASDTASEKVTSFWNSARLSYQKQRSRFSLNAGYKSVDDEYYFSPTALPNNNKSKLLQALAVYEHRFSDKTTVTGGVQAQNRIIRSNDRGNHKVAQATGFLIFNQQVGKALRINPALRADWDERAGAELVPQLALSYQKGMIQLRGAAGKTIRQADFTERYNNYNKAFVARGSIGNPALKAEKSFSFEGGADVFLLPHWRISGTYFQRAHTDLIDFVVTPYADMPRKENLSPTGVYALALNVSEITTRGWETDVFFQQSFSERAHLQAGAGLVWLASETDEARDLFYVRSHAKFMTNFNLRYTFKNVAVALNGLYKVREARKATAAIAQVSSEYFLFNALAEIGIYKKNIRLFAQVDNVLDKTYADLLGAQMPGRWLMGGIKVSVGK